MRKNKKILLGAIAAMSVLGIGVGATSTFAWFQVNSVSVSSTANDKTGLNVNNNPTAAVGSYTVTFSATWTEDGTYTAATTHLVDNSGDEYVWQSGVLVPATSASGTHKYGKITVQLTDIVKINDGSSDTVKASMTTEQKKLVAGSYLLTVTASSARMHLHASAPSSNYLAASATITAGITLSDALAVSGNSSVDIYYTIDGTGATDDKDGTAGSATLGFSLSLTHTSFTPAA